MITHLHCSPKSKSKVQSPLTYLESWFLQRWLKDALADFGPWTLDFGLVKPSDAPYRKPELASPSKRECRSACSTNARAPAVPEYPEGQLRYPVNALRRNVSARAG